MPVGIKYIEKGGSAQIKSAAILAGLNSFGKTKVIVKKDSRDHTENILKKLAQKFLKKILRRAF